MPWCSGAVWSTFPGSPLTGCSHVDYMSIQSSRSRPHPSEDLDRRGYFPARIKAAAQDPHDAANGYAQQDV